MFLIDKDKEITTAQIGDIINRFITTDLVRLNKYYNYYKGNQQILAKQATDIGKPCNRIVVNYCYDIVNNYLGYLTGIDISYSSKNDFADIMEVLNYNDCHTEDSELLCDALTFGIAYEINYIDEDLKQRFKRLEPRECIAVYDNTLNQDLACVIRFYEVDMVNEKDKEYIVEVYDNRKIKVYKSNYNFSNFMLLAEKEHYFNQVPITVFTLNREETSIFNQVMSLQDAYNNLLSSEVDDFEAFADAYLVLKGVTADTEDLADMKKNRVLLLDADAEASYLTKSITDTQIQNMLENINDQIHKISKSPDFNDDKLMAQSGIAMRYKLIGFENMSAAIEARMKKALQKRIELICSVLNLTGIESTWRDVEIKFTRNLPSNIVEIAEVVNSFRGLIPDVTLLSQVPFIDNPQEQIELLQKEKEDNMSLYNFGSAELTNE